MTVSELIDHLQRLPPNQLVLVEGYENGWDSLMLVQSANLTRQHQCAEWDGEYELSNA